MDPVQRPPALLECMIRFYMKDHKDHPHRFGFAQNSTGKLCYIMFAEAEQPKTLV